MGGRDSFFFWLMLKCGRPDVPTKKKKTSREGHFFFFWLLLASLLSHNLLDLT